MKSKVAFRGDLTIEGRLVWDESKVKPFVIGV